MSNLDQIAKLSGFSKATVSRVLNHSPHVSQATRERILAIMEELDYVPNGNAISLSRGETMQIGMVTEGLNEVMLPFLNSFVETASRHGYQTIVYTSGETRPRSCRRSRICGEKSRCAGDYHLRQRPGAARLLLQIRADCILAADEAAGDPKCGDEPI